MCLTPRSCSNTSKQLLPHPEGTHLPGTTVLREDLGPETAALICRPSQKEPARFWSLQQKLTP
jgi:hypothetical protein